jgi:hypothetical protein
MSTFTHADCTTSERCAADPGGFFHRLNTDCGAWTGILSEVLPTQREAIQRAKELNPGKAPLVERVRDTARGGRDKWRKA